MAKARKDNKGRALRKGESQRTDNTYVHTLIRSRNADLYMPEIYRH